MGDFSEILGRFDTKSAFLCAFASSFFPMALRHGAPASNKPHPAESGTLPHRPWATMPLVNGRTRKRSAAGGWSEAEVCAEERAAPRKPMR